MTADLPPVLFDYFAEREKGRRMAVNAALAGLSEREVLLVREAAVMGWVQGKRHHDLTVPKVSQILATVVDACISPSFRDLYPMISGYVPDTSEEES